MNSNNTELQLKTADKNHDAVTGMELLRKEAMQGSWEAFEHYLNAVPDVPPQDDDHLEN